MSETKNSAVSTASFLGRTHGGVVEAFARSHLNPFGLCGEASPAASIDITEGFGDPRVPARRDIVDQAQAAIAGERLVPSTGGDRSRPTVPGGSEQMAARALAFRADASAALATVVTAASTAIRGVAAKARSGAADVLASPPGVPAIACWLGAATFVALPLLPDLDAPQSPIVEAAETSVTAKPDQAGSSEMTMSFPEEPPAIGTTLQFDRANLRYCIYQQVRLEAIGPVTYSTEADVFAALIKEWNSRCSRFRYVASDKDAIDSEVKARRAELESEGRALVRGWQRKIETTLQHLPAPESASAVATSTSSRSEASDPLPSIIMLGRNPKSEIGGGFNPLLKSPSLVLLRSDSAMRVQERLNELGYTIKPADGNWGPTSRSALRRFKEANGLLANDGFDIETAVRLFSASASAPRAIASSASTSGDIPGTFESAYPPPPGASLNPLNRADAERVQRRLAALGYYGAKAYGLWGVTSRRALRAFKVANDLADDDEWDAITETVLADEQAVRVAAFGGDGSAATSAPVAASPTSTASPAAITGPGATAAPTAPVKPDPPTKHAVEPKPAKRTSPSHDEGLRPRAGIPVPVTPRPAGSSAVAPAVR
jgi:peptidoglycan hydrolase-like protein with peptidoglycan-binding domain